MAQTFSVLAGHAPRSPAEPGFFPWFSHRLKQIPFWQKSIYVIEIGIDKDVTSVVSADICDLLLVETAHFRPEQIPARIAGDVNWNLSR
jgi:hypothetical protein